MAKKRIDVRISEGMKPVTVTHTKDDHELTEAQFEKIQLFKIQLPLNKPQGIMDLALIYNEDRSIDSHVPALEMRQYFQPGEYKIYLFGYEENGNVQLFAEPKAEEQDW